MTRETPVGLKFGDEELEGVLGARRDHAQRPGVILFPTVLGVCEVQLGSARQRVHLRYAGFGADLFGPAFPVAPRAVLSPPVMGASELDVGFARRLVHRGYAGFVADLFGKAFRGAPRDVMMDELKRLRSDPASLRERLLAVLDSARGQEAIEPDR